MSAVPAIERERVAARGESHRPMEFRTPTPTCPSCGAPVPAPEEDEKSFQGGRICDACKRPLTWFFDRRSGGRWILDEGAEGRRRMAGGPEA